MLKYFYYLWNLLKGIEKIELFYHFGKCLLSAVLYTIIDWQHLILIYIISQYDTSNIVWAVIGTQFFVWGISLWYYFLKYKIMNAQNKFFKLLSNRHYEYILSRLSKNASYLYLHEKSSFELSKQLDSTDKGLQHIFSFLSTFVKLLATIAMSLFVISFNYQICGVLFLLFGATTYYISTRKLVYRDEKSNLIFTYINQESSKIISDSVSALLDSVLHEDYNKLINNIVAYNSKTKNKQLWLYSQQDKLHTKIGLGLITGYILTLIMITLSMKFKFEQFTIFFIASLLTYKCISNNINLLLDKYSDVRQSQLDFDSLEDIWIETNTQRKTFDIVSLPNNDLNLQLFDSYKIIRFNNFDKILIDHLLLIISNNNLINDFNTFVNDHKKYNFVDNSYSANVYYLELLKKFVYSKKSLIDEVQIPNNDILIYNSFNKNTNLIYKLKLLRLHFQYPSDNDSFPFELEFNSNPITFNSFDNVLIKGTSGSGKTTFLKIIRGILPLEYSSTQTHNFVNLELNINNIKKYVSFTNLSKYVSYSQQNSNTSFLSGNIFQIITGDYICSNYEHYKKHILQSLEVACVETKFKDLKFCITKNNISGGQRQRLIIARNVFRLLTSNKQIIILDEIDQGIDYITARQILLNIFVLFANKLVFVVTHTENLQTLFDKVLTINSGSISLLT